jgi:hypothetical protein
MNNAGISTALPIVGLPMKVGEATAMATVTCACHPSNAPMLIRGIDVGARCPACARTYAITAIVYDVRAGAPFHVSVSLIGVAADKGSDS